jgi:hypothetical protein
VSLSDHIAANQQAIGVVLFPDAKTGQLVAGGTAFHVGAGVFITSDHVLGANPVGRKVLVWLNWTTPNLQPAEVTHRNAADDVAVLAFETELDIPALALSFEHEPIGQAVFTYGFIAPECKLENGAWVTSAIPRAATGIIGSRYVRKGSLAYELDFATYPGESGAPVFRAIDNVVIGVVSGSRTLKTPEGNVRGPTLAAPLTHLRDVLEQ